MALCESGLGADVVKSITGKSDIKWIYILIAAAVGAAAVFLVMRQTGGVPVDPSIVPIPTTPAITPLYPVTELLRVLGVI